KEDTILVIHKPLFITSIQINILAINLKLNNTSPFFVFQNKYSGIAQILERGSLMPKKVKKGILITGLLLFLSFYIGTIYYQENKPLPKGVSYEGDIHYLQEDQVQFLYDLTYKNGKKTKHEQVIFDTVFQAIDEAEKFVIMDFFLFNDYYDQSLDFPPLSSSLMNKLIEKKKR